MGCPDWPKCYGGLMPPTSEATLPANYREIFKEKRLAKVEKFASVLERVGFVEQARSLREHPLIGLPEHFDPWKAWIEYVNRLFGVLSGIFALWFLVVTFRHRALRRYGTWVALGFAFLVVNGWLGSIVVATNLIPGIVSLHFMLAFLCLFAYMVALHRESPFAWATHPVVQVSTKWSWGAWLGVWGLVTLGTWAREGVEALRLAGTLGTHELNVEGMDFAFVLHRYLPLLLLALSGWQCTRLVRARVWSLTDPWSAILLMSSTQVLLGAVHIVYVVPIWAQVAHIVIGSGLLVAMFVWALSEGARQCVRDSRSVTT